MFCTLKVSRGLSDALSSHVTGKHKSSGPALTVVLVAATAVLVVTAKAVLVVATPNMLVPKMLESLSLIVTVVPDALALTAALLVATPNRSVPKVVPRLVLM